MCLNISAGAVYHCCMLYQPCVLCDVFEGLGPPESLNSSASLVGVRRFDVNFKWEVPVAIFQVLS